MKAMILAAGKGTRLKSLTRTVPKPMVPVAGRPMLEYIVEQIRNAGITELWVNIHHLPEKIQTHFGDGSRFGVRIAYSPERELLGTAGAVKLLESHFTETFLLYYGDNYVEIDLKDFVQKHKASLAIATIAIFHCSKPHMSGIVKVDDHGNVLKFVEKPPKDAGMGNLANAGVYALEPRILSHIPGGESSDFGRDIFPRVLQSGEKISAYILKGQVIGIDTPRLHARLESYLYQKSRNP